jgi:hypothetical protein
VLIVLFVCVCLCDDFICECMQAAEAELVGHTSREARLVADLNEQLLEVQRAQRAFKVQRACEVQRVCGALLQSMRIGAELKDRIGRSCS